VALVVGAATVSFVRSQALAMRTEAGQLDMNDTARGVIELMAREIRMAGYNPRCLTPSPVTAIVSAAPQRLRVQYDLNENGVLDGGAAASEDVLYDYDAATQSVLRTVGGQVSTLATDVPASGFAFRYYQQDGTELVPQGGVLSGAQMTAVWRVSIRLEPAKAADPRVATTVRSSSWTNVLLRNRQTQC
jgi:type II secretory pathway component PulJ